MQEEDRFLDRLDVERLKGERVRNALEDRGISEGVFDRKTLMTLYELSRRNDLRLGGIVSTGKESNIYHGFLGDVDVAVKIYCIETSDFRNMSKYIRGDPRFLGWRDRRHLIYLWAQKEYKNLSRVYGRVSCPKPFAVLNNVLVMGFVGKKGVPAPKLRETKIRKPAEYFNKIVGHIKEMYSLGIVHGDLSGYNILDYRGPVLIDFSQGVLLSHPMAEELLQRDVRNMLDFFGKYKIKKDFAEILGYIQGV